MRIIAKGGVCTDDVLELDVTRWPQDAHLGRNGYLGTITVVTRFQLWLGTQKRTDGKISIISGRMCEWVGACALACSTTGQIFSIISAFERSFARSEGRMRHPVWGLPAPNTIAAGRCEYQRHRKYFKYKPSATYGLFPRMASSIGTGFVFSPRVCTSVSSSRPIYLYLAFQSDGENLSMCKIAPVIALWMPQE